MGEADELQAIMDDYNENFGTSFTTENFRAYYDDINLQHEKEEGGNETACALSCCGYVPYRL